MAWAAKHPCAKPGCPALVEQGERFCENHAKQIIIRHDRSSISSAKRGYGFRWQKLRELFLAQNPLCANPFRIPGHEVLATDVHHKIPKERGGSDDWDNLQALCEPCHGRITVEQDGGFGNERKM